MAAKFNPEKCKLMHIGHGLQTVTFSILCHFIFSLESMTNTHQFTLGVTSLEYVTFSILGHLIFKLQVSQEEKDLRI